MKTKALHLQGWLLSFALLFGGCTDMKDQPRFETFEASKFYADGSSSRGLIEGTVARGQLREDDHLYRGLDENGKFATDWPMTIDAELLARGSERYDIFCSPCHDRSGYGNGMIVRRGYKKPTSFHTARLRSSEPGYYFDVISNGFGAMSSYASQVPVEDRWAIIAHVRALQLRQDGRLSDVDSDLAARLSAGESVDTRADDQPGETPGETHGH